MPRCVAQTSKGTQCTKSVAEQYGCTRFCWQHAQCYLRDYICHDDADCTEQEEMDFLYHSVLQEVPDKQRTASMRTKRINAYNVLTDSIDLYIDAENSKEYNSRNNASMSQMVANAFEYLVREEIGNIVVEHHELDIRVNGINVVYPDSPFLASTCLGFLMEVLVERMYPDFWLVGPAHAPYDLKFNNDKFDLYVNLKVEKMVSLTGNYSLDVDDYTKYDNKGIVSNKNIIDLYNSNDKPKLYLIVKITYVIDEDKGIIGLNITDYLFLDSIISKVDRTKPRLALTTDLKYNKISKIPSYNRVLKIING